MMMMMMMMMMIRMIILYDTKINRSDPDDKHSNTQDIKIKRKSVIVIKIKHPRKI